MAAPGDCCQPSTPQSCLESDRTLTHTARVTLLWKDPQLAARDQEHHAEFNEGSALAPGQLVSFTSLSF